MGTINWLLATHNQGKIRELRSILEPFPIEVQGLSERGINSDSPESGATFLENAMQKASFYYKHAKTPVVADDSGLEVDALNGAPGIFSARFGGFETHVEKVAYLLDLIKEVEEPYRTARFHCAAVYYDGWRYLSAEGSIEGYLSMAPAGDGGFGYDPIFQPELKGPTLAQIPLDEKNKISHRGKAFKDLVGAVLRLSDVHL